MNEKPIILAVETSTLTASVALLMGDRVVIERESGVNSHSELLLSLIDECLRSASLQLADLTTIAVGAGPGSFTGLRIGMATVKGLCFASGVSLTPVSSLAALALDGQRAVKANNESPLIVSVLDARRKEIFVGLFTSEGGALRALGPEQVLSPAELAPLVAEYREERYSGPFLCGDGAFKYRELVEGIGSIVEDARLTPAAGDIARLARHLPAADLLASAAPTYVRLPEAEIKFPDGNTGGTFSLKSADAPHEGAKSQRDNTRESSE